MRLAGARSGLNTGLGASTGGQESGSTGLCGERGQALTSFQRQKMMPEALTEDDPEDHIAFDGRSIANACAACVLHLADLKQFELWPVNWTPFVGPRDVGFKV